MTLSDYLLFRSPEQRMAGQDGVPGARIAVAFLGLFLGIVASFLVTNIRPSPPRLAPAHESAAAGVATAAGEQSNRALEPTPTGEPRLGPFSWQRLWQVGLIALVICGLSFQSLYFTLKLYSNQPAWLVWFVAFQYGYFWQSLVEGGKRLMS